MNMSRNNINGRSESGYSRDKRVVRTTKPEVTTTPVKDFVSLLKLKVFTKWVDINETCGKIFVGINFNGVVPADDYAEFEKFVYSEYEDSLYPLVFSATYVRRRGGRNGDVEIKKLSAISAVKGVLEKNNIKITEMKRVEENSLLKEDSEEHVWDVTLGVESKFYTISIEVVDTKVEIKAVM